MKKRRKIPGLWWFPETPTEKWVGTLTLAPSSGPRLRVTVPKGFGHKFEACPPVLHGCDQHGKPITLLFTVHPEASGSAVLSHLTFSAGYAVLGIQLRDPTEFLVNSLMIESQHLYEWSGITGFVRTGPSTARDLQIQYRCPEAQSFTIDSDLSIEVRATYSSRTTRSERDVHESLCVEFLSKQGLNLTRCKELVNAIRELLHFAVLEPVFPLRITAEKEGYGDSFGGDFFPKVIELWSSIIREPVESEFLAERWMFQFKDVQSDFGKFMTMWLEYLKKYDEALGCYSTTIYHRLPHEVAHLCLTQALDAYHGVKYVSHEERGFEDKIRELTDAHKDPLRGIVDDVADFATTVVHNRNYYTHHNPRWKQEGRIVSGGSLYRLNEKLRLIFQMCVLTDIGIPSDRFKRLRRQLATLLIDYA